MARAVVPTAAVRRPSSRRGTAIERLRRSRPGRVAWPSIAAAATLGLVLTLLAFRAGGYFPTETSGAAAACFAVLAVLLAMRRPAWVLSTDARLALFALGALTAWTGLSLAWSPAPDAGTEDFQRLLLYLAIFGLALVAAGSGRHSRALLWLALAVCMIIAGAGLVSRLAPELLSPQEPAGAAYRLSYPLTYWNALGAVAAMGAILALGLAGNPRAGAATRGLAAGTAVVLVTTMSLTFSRASWLALIVGVVALVVLGGHRGSLLLTLGVVGTAAGLSVLRLQGYDALVDTPTAGDGQAVEGQAFAVQLAVLCAGAGVSVGFLAAGRRSVMVMDGVRRIGRPVLTGLVALTLAVGLLAYVVQADSVEGRTNTALADAGEWVEDQWDIFMTPTAFSASGSGRLTTAQGTRSAIYAVALDGLRDAPVIGGGAGSFESRWYRERDVDENLRDAHSLGFETLAELGLVGGLLLGLLLATFGRAIVRTRVRGGAVARAEAAAAGAACSVWFVHALVDWDWQMPAVSGLTLVLAAAMLPEGRRRGLPAQRSRAVPTAV